MHRVCPDTPRAREFLAGVQWVTDSLRDMPAAARELLLRAGVDAPPAAAGEDAAAR